VRKKLKGLWQQLQLVPAEEVKPRIHEGSVIPRLIARFFPDPTKEVTTFTEIAATLDCSHEFVRLRLVKHPAVFPIGNKYRVPRSVAVEFISDLYKAA
jgi:hypothetical protein